MNSNACPSISIVIPVYNEEENVKLLSEPISETMDDFNYELILVGDGSTDKTRQNVKAIDNPHLILVELKKIRTKLGSSCRNRFSKR